MEKDQPIVYTVKTLEEMHEDLRAEHRGAMIELEMARGFRVSDQERYREARQQQILANYVLQDFRKKYIPTWPEYQER